MQNLYALEIDFSVLPVFLIAVLIILIAPGPDMVFMVASGLAGGRSAATRAAFGITLGVSVYVILTAAGLATLLASAPAALDLIRLIGAFYLLYLAVQTWRTTQEDSVASSGRIESDYFRRGFIVNLTNPKIALFFVAFLPQFIGDVEGNPGLQLLMLGLVLQIAGLVVDLIVGYAAGSVRDLVLESKAARIGLERLSASVYGILSLVLFVEVFRSLIA